MTGFFTLFQFQFLFLPYNHSFLEINRAPDFPTDFLLGLILILSTPGSGSCPKYWQAAITKSQGAAPYLTKLVQNLLTCLKLEQIWFDIQFVNFTLASTIFPICFLCVYVLICAPRNNGVHKYRNNVFRCNHSFWNGLKVRPVNRQRGRWFCPNKKPTDERITLYWRQVAMASFCCRCRILFENP